MKYTQTTPCKECPFLNSMKRGFTMKRLTELAVTEFPCHKTCDLIEDEEGLEEYIGSEESVACAGAMIFLAKRKDRFTFGFDTSKLNMKANVR